MREERPMTDAAIELAAVGIDAEGLNKGDELAADVLEAITGHRRETKRYNLKILGLRARIERAMQDRGKPATVAVKNGRLRILTDEEAARYNHDTFRHGLRKARRAYDRLLAVDTRPLAEDLVREHLRHIEVDGKILSAIASTRAQCRRLPLDANPNGHQRTTPGLPDQK